MFKNFYYFHRDVSIKQLNYSKVSVHISTSIFLLFSRAEIDSNANADASQMDRKYVFGL